MQGRISGKGDFTFVTLNPEKRFRLYDIQAEETIAMAGKTTREPIDSHDSGPKKAGEKVGPEKPNLDQENLDRAPVLDQRDYIVDGNTVVQPTEAEEGKPFDAEQYEKDRADAAGASSNVPPLDDVKIGLVEGGQGNPAAATHSSGFMDVPKAEGDPDSIRAWNARKAAEAQATGAEGQAETDAKTEAAQDANARRAETRTAASRQADADAKKSR